MATEMTKSEANTMLSDAFREATEGLRAARVALGGRPLIVAVGFFEGVYGPLAKAWDDIEDAIDNIRRAGNKVA